jgi:hypothetical protein
MDQRLFAYSLGFSGFGSGAGSSCAKLAGADKPAMELIKLNAKTIAKAIITFFIMLSPPFAGLNFLRDALRRALDEQPKCQISQVTILFFVQRIQPLSVRRRESKKITVANSHRRKLQHP